MNTTATCRCGTTFIGEVIAGPLCTPHVVCPKCGKECVVGKIERYDVHRGNRNFYGEESRSLVHGCHPAETGLLRKLVGPKYEHCVLDSGDVKFRNRKEERGFAAAFQEARMRNAVSPGCYMSARSQARDKKIAEQRAQQSATR